MSFDRMRNMLNRAAEVRESEQQQIFDALDEIHARLQPVESLGAVRKRLSELPDRTEVSVLAERLDEALAKLEAQDSAIGTLGRAVDGMVDKLAKPFAQLDGRLDGVAGRFEGVAGRMDGLEAALRGRVDEVGEGVHEHLDGTREALYRSVTESTAAVGTSVDKAAETLHGRFTQAHDALTGKLAETGNSLRAGVDEARTTLRTDLDSVKDHVSMRIEESRAALDATDRLGALTERLEQVTSRLDAMAARLDAVESGIGGRLGELSTSVEQGLQQVRGTVTARPDTDSLISLVRNANEESERRNAGQLDEAMATFAELILGGGAPSPPPPP